MNSDKLFDIIESIAGTSSKNGKQELIAANASNSDFVRVLEAALNPFKTYGIAKRPEIESHGTGWFDDHTWEILDDLRSRALTGNAARVRLESEMARLTSWSAELLWRIVSKDLRAGFSESTVNKAIPGTIPTFDCMLAHPFEEKRVKKWPVVAEPKLDGVRVLAFADVDNREVKFFSRSGKEFTTFDHLKEPLIEVINDFRAYIRHDQHADADSDYFFERLGCNDMAFIFDGEIVSGSFNKTVSEVRKKDAQATDAIFNVFDILPMSLFKEDSKVPSKHTYSERRAVLEDLLKNLEKTEWPIQLLPRYLVSSVAEIHALYERVRARGLEGLIIKDPDAPYHRKRSHAWLKIKAEETVDVKIVGIEPGTGKYEGMIGALVVNFNGVKVNVGSGLSDDMRGEDHSLFLDRLIEVEYHEVTPDGSLRHPRFKRFRDDKA